MLTHSNNLAHNNKSRPFFADKNNFFTCCLNLPRFRGQAILCISFAASLFLFFVATSILVVVSGCLELSMVPRQG
jgi:hypothetical protein